MTTTPSIVPTVILIFNFVCSVHGDGDTKPEIPSLPVERDSPAVQFRFYDVTFDDQLCDGPDQELRGEAVDNYIYLGRLLETSEALKSQLCIQKCYQHSKCTSVNYYKPKSFGNSGFCELLAETQWSNPKWMRRFHGAVYYDSITCQQGGKKGTNFQHHDNQPKGNSQTSHFLKSLFTKIADFSRRAQRTMQ